MPKTISTTKMRQLTKQEGYHMQGYEDFTRGENGKFVSTALIGEIKINGKPSTIIADPLGVEIHTDKGVEVIDKDFTNPSQARSFVNKLGKIKSLSASKIEQFARESDGNYRSIR